MLITRLSLANLKKKKGAAVTLIIFMLLASALLNIGITLVSKMGSIYEQKEMEDCSLSGNCNLYWMPWSVRMDHLQKLQDSEGAGSNQ